MLRVAIWSLIRPLFTPACTWSCSALCLGQITSQLLPASALRPLPALPTCAGDSPGSAGTVLTHPVDYWQYERSAQGPKGAPDIAYSILWVREQAFSCIWVAWLSGMRSDRYVVCAKALVNGVHSPDSPSCQAVIPSRIKLTTGRAKTQRREFHLSLLQVFLPVNHNDFNIHKK